MNERPAAFPIAPLRFTLRSAGLTFPDFSGSVWHGGLGKMLAQHFPTSYQLLYGGQNLARLYALRPPVDERFPPGRLLTFHLNLFGAATGHVLACTQAIALLGEAGMDPAGHYRLEEASVLLSEGDAVFFRAGDGLITAPQVADFREWLGRDAPQQRVGIRLLTPLFIKEGNKQLQEAPSYAQLLHRLFSRLDQLAHVIGSEPPIAKCARAPLFEEARQVALVGAEIGWPELSRRSARTKQQMKLEGLLGHLQFAGELTHTLPWLIAGQQVQIGAKTAFGFGGYQIQIDYETGGSRG